VFRIKIFQLSEITVFSYRLGNLPRARHTVDFDYAVLDEVSVRLFFEKDPVDRWRVKAYSSLLHAGYVGHVFHKGDDWAAVQWIATPTSGGPPHLPSSLTAGHYWCFNDHTRVPYRRQGLWSVLKEKVMADVRKMSEGSDALVFSDTSVKNLPSRRAFERFGFNHAGTIRALSVQIPRTRPFNFGRWALDVEHPKFVETHEEN
jgi:hypothetical protein